MHEADVSSNSSTSRCCVLGDVWDLWGLQGVSEGISGFLSPLICVCRYKLAAERSHKKGGWQMGSVPIASFNGGKLHLTCPDGSPANRAGMGNGQQELESCAQSEISDIIWITNKMGKGTCWMSMMDSYKIFWKDKKGRRGVGIVLYVRSSVEVWRYRDHESSWDQSWNDYHYEGIFCLVSVTDLPVWVTRPTKYSFNCSKRILGSTELCPHDRFQLPWHCLVKTHSSFNRKMFTRLIELFSDTNTGNAD